MQRSGGEEISHLSNRTKQNDPKQTDLHISAPTNLQYESLWQEILTSIKQYGKTEIKSIIKKYTYCFFTIWNLKSAITYKWGLAVLSLALLYFAISKLILSFSYSFHIPRITLSSVYFCMIVPCFPFVLIDQNRKQL